MPISTPRFIQLALPVLATALLLAAAACGGSDPAPTATPRQERPAADPTPIPAPATSAPATSAPTTAPASPAPTTAPSTGPRSTGDVDGITFIVSDGSEATFTVEEQLANLTLPNDAVMRTTDLSGEVRLDGGDSLITLGLQGMTSDNTFRDGYVRNRLLANQQSATLAFGDLTPLPSGFLEWRRGRDGGNRHDQHQRHRSAPDVPDAGPRRRERHLRARTHHVHMGRPLHARTHRTSSRKRRRHRSRRGAPLAGTTELG